MTLTITFLGTGTSLGIPVIGNTHPVCLSSNKKDKRLRSSVLISWHDATYIIDCSPDFRQQMLRANCTKINGILFTHEHADHTAGLDDIRPFYFKQGAIPIYATKTVIKSLKKRFDYIFATKNKYPGAPSIMVNTFKNEPFRINTTQVTPIKGYHNQLEVFGFRFFNIAYLTDMNRLEESEWCKLENLDVLIINALRHEKHPSHFTLNEALRIIDKFKPKRSYLTHISHLLGFHEEVQKTLPENVFLAYDELQITSKFKN